MTSIQNLNDTFDSAGISEDQQLNIQNNEAEVENSGDQSSNVFTTNAKVRVDFE